MDHESAQWWTILLMLAIISSPSKQDPTIRLADGDERQGRVEVYFDGEWGTVCDDRWDVLDGDVACRQLGFLFADEVKAFGEGQGKIFMDEVNCDGTEKVLFECQYSQHHDCRHSEDAGLVCSDAFDVRLVNGDKMHGLVEVYMDRQWGPVCADRWDIIDADIVCRQLGYLHATNATKQTSSTNDTLIGSVKCRGKENILSECSYVVYPNCTEGEISRVTCSADEERLEIIFCPSDISVPVPPGVIKATVEWDDPIVTGRLINTTSSHESGYLFDLGLTEVTYNFTSKSGNVTSCSFYVALCPADCNDVRQYCPASVTKEVEAGTNTSRIYWSERMFNKCHYNVSKTHSSGEEFSLGNTEVTFTCTDSKFVYNLCKFDVRVVSEVETASSSVPPLIKKFFKENIWVIVTTTLGFGIFVMVLLLLIQICRKRRSDSSNRVQLRLNGINIQQPVNKADDKWKDEGCLTYRTSLKDSDNSAVYEEPSAVFDEIKNSKPVELENKRLYSKHFDCFDEDVGPYVTMN